MICAEETLIPDKMKAVIFEQYGDPDVLEFTDFPVPTPARGEALVKVDAVSLNGYDLMARTGRCKPNKGKFPHLLGGDFGGEVVALGVEMSCDLPLGSRVASRWLLPCNRCEQRHHNRCARDYRYLGAHEHGAYAEYVKRPADDLILLPDMPLLGSGKLKTVIDRVFPLREAAEARRHLESAKQFGKVVLHVDH
jgi:NADPH:quinone reductase-like Zn-dependent oxidoreductase